MISRTVRGFAPARSSVMWAAIRRPSFSGVYQWGLVGRDGDHFRQSAMVGPYDASGSGVPKLNAACGLNVA
jgi:hypothetical protein